MKIFLSAVSSQFRECRNALASDLRATGAEVVVQEDFVQHDWTLLAKLEQLVAGCDRVIALVGDAYGFEPPEESRPPGQPRRSYSQWEYAFALGERLDGPPAPRKPLYVYFADKTYLDVYPVPQDPEQAALQQQFLQSIRDSGKDRNTFHSLDALCRLALRDGFQVRDPGCKPNNLPYHSIGSLFKGRDDFLDDLRVMLGGSQGRAVGVLARQAIHGLGGVGKTRLAVEYAWRHQSDYTALLFVMGDTPANLRRTLSELVGPLVLDLGDVQEAKEEEVRLAAALHWLETHPGWFLIVDNVDTEEAALEVEALLPRLQGGHVVITSRLKAWGAGVEPLELDVLDGAAARDFLLERTAGRRRLSASDADVAAALATALDGLALALEQAGAYIGHVRCTLADYLNRWAKADQLVREWFDPRLMKYPRSVAVTWEATWARLAPASRVLLEILSWFAPDAIPEDVVTGERSRPIATAALGGVDVELALADLDRYSMLTRHVRDGSPTLQVHRLVQEVTRRRNSNGLQQALELAKLAAVGNPSDVRTWSTWEPLAPHLRILVEHADWDGIAVPTAQLMDQLGVYLLTKASYAEAEPLMRRALEIDERMSGHDHPKVATRLNNLAQLLKDTGRLGEAEPLMRRALEIDERSYGPDHPEVAIDLNNLAQLLKDTGRLAEAEPLVRRVVVILDAFQRSTGHEHPHFRATVRNYIGLLKALGQEPEQVAQALRELTGLPPENP